MKQITRKEASQILHEVGVIDTKIEHNENELLVYSNLPNSQSLLVKYDMVNHGKSYFVEK